MNADPSNQQRRAILEHGASVVAGLLADPRASAGEPHLVNADLLDFAQLELSRLRRQDGHQGGAEVIPPVVMLTDHLTRMLHATRHGSAAQRRVARLTMETADLTA